MTAATRDLLVLALRDPRRASAWPADRLSLLLHQARRAGLLGRLAERMGAVPGADVPPALQAHFEAARRVAAAQQAEIRREAAYLAAALDGLGAPVVLLKGAAYAMAGLPAASGRVFGDIDLMVPRSHLDDAESRLRGAGWQPTPHTDYDEQYYRRWMHELPPLEHAQRGTTLDVHHAIVPLTGRLQPDAASMFARAVPLAGRPPLHVLAPDDLVLHAMTHLFVNDDTSYGLRDLSDIDLLLRHFADADAGFWTSLTTRAREQGLGTALADVARAAQATFGTPIPAEAAAAVASLAPRGPRRALMGAVWSRALRSPHPSAQPAGAACAQALLYVRGHALRMPPAMLVRHLATKALQRWRERGDDAERTVG